MSGSYTERFSEVHYPLINVAPAVKSPAAAQVSAYVSMANYHRAALVIHLGAIAATGTAVIQILQGATSVGGSSKGIPTTVGQTKTLSVTTADANTVKVIELRTEELDVAGGFEYVAVSYDVDTDTVALSLVLYGIISRFNPVPTTNWDEIVD
jgi:hypothetical protein